MEHKHNHFTIRLSPDLRGWLMTQANTNCRSFNQEIAQRLERTRWQDDPGSRPASARVDQAAGRAQ